MYKWDAEEYRKSSENQEKWAKELIGLLKLEGHEQVLDIGCGDGRITAGIASKLPEGQVLGIDSSDEMIKLAQETFNPEKYPNLKFKVLDAREIDFNNHFNIVFSNAALHWIKNHVPVLKRIRNALKVDGKLILQMGGQGNAQAILDEVDNRIIVEKKWHNYFTDFVFPYAFFGDEKYAEMILESGLKPIRVELINKIMTHSDREELKGWIRTTWLPYTQRVPKELQEEFINEIASAYIEKYAPDSNIEINMVRLEVEAERVD